jgi:putative flippase GtrA
MSPTITRFSKYSVVGASTFVFDLALLFLLVDVFLVEQVIAAGVAFFIAISINYYISRQYVFKHSHRSLQSSYANFILIASVGVALVTGGMYIMTHLLAWNYLIARIIVAGMTGIWNYLMNLYVNFKVAGKH